MRNLLIIVVVAIVLAGGYFFFISKRSSNNNNNSNNNGQTASRCSDTPEATASATIVYSNSGFTPSLVAVSSGGSLTMKNESDNPVHFSSDPHPVHTDNPELNMNEVASGGEQTVTLNTTGCFGYHDHLDSSMTGSILIK